MGDYLQKRYTAKPSKRLKAGIQKPWRFLKDDSPPSFKLDQCSIHFPHFPWIFCQEAPVKRPLKISITKAKAAPLAPPKGKVTPWKACLSNVELVFGLLKLNGLKGSRYVLRKGISPTILLWGWDWDHQSYSREESGFLGGCGWYCQPRHWLKTNMFLMSVCCFA